MNVHQNSLSYHRKEGGREEGKEGGAEGGKEGVRKGGMQY